MLGLVSTPSRRLRGAAVLANPLVADLLERRLVAVFCTHEPDGAIHAVAVWYASDGDAVVLATGSGSRKVANVARDARATLVLHDSRPGAEVCGACLIGRAEVVRAADAGPAIELVHRRYVTTDGLRLPAVRAFLGGDDVAVRFRAERAFTWDERGSDAARALAATGAAHPLEPTSPYGAAAVKRLQ
jgi:PPOX class probable F420-dependent enzyme